ncbi:MAG: ATP-grasp domain-containing protein [Proteobacteria bacterium]|nr:ATP-grasp domain-containing protein [Pseudomonadota bacterium]MCK4488482.1 ATP-grasp domain-containing protein [Desulfobacterales bacterium]
MQNGSVFARFAHQRIREKPPGGGVSVLCQSISPPREALEAATSLMKSLGWFGPAMVEFKWDRRDNKPKLMEVNGRFWGSLQLAISSGIDFPYLLYCLASGEKINRPSNYKVCVRSRWELGDLDHLLIRLRKRRQELFLQPNAPSR